MNNPFTLMYGLASASTISREKEENRILESFLGGDYIYAYFISGIRGCGKTVLLRNVIKRLTAEKDWIGVDLNPRGDLLESFSIKLQHETSFSNLLDGLSVSVSLGAVTLTKRSGEKITDPEIVAETIVEKLNKQGKKIVISIDEVTNTEPFRKFINFYQSIIGSGRPLYLLMTGVNDNINSIINDSAMTFLTRSPRIALGPLELPSVALGYEKELKASKENAIEMAKLTKGYAFAYQVLGYICYERGKNKVDNDIINEYSSHLWSSGYGEYWNDLTQKEKEFMFFLSESKTGEKAEMINRGFSGPSYSLYRQRLLEKGLIYAPAYGYLDFTLPTFKEYVSYQKQFNEN